MLCSSERFLTSCPPAPAGRAHAERGGRDTKGSRPGSRRRTAHRRQRVRARFEGLARARVDAAVLSLKAGNSGRVSKLQS